MINKIRKIINKPNIILNHILMLRWSRWIKDDIYLKMKYRVLLGKKLNLKNPESFNEKLQWLKLNDRRTIYTTMVDKYEAKKYVSSIIGEDKIIPTLGVWDRFDDIDFNKLPNQFVLKCTHDSGGLLICKDKSRFDINAARKKINKSLRCNYYYLHREWPYRDVKPRIMAEKYMEESSGGLVDYKFFCFNGKADCVMLCLDRHLGNTKFYFFDKGWNLLRLNKRGLEAPEDFTLPKPDSMDDMFKIADMLSQKLSFARVDLYSINDIIYFSEITFFPDSGFDKNILDVADDRWKCLINTNLIGG